MNENQNTNKIRPLLLTSLIAIGLGYLCYGMTTQSFTRITLIESEVGASYETGAVKESEEITGQTILRKHSNGISDGGTESKSSKQVQPTNTKIVLKYFGTGDIRQEYANYAYKIGGENLLYLILCENGGLVLNLQSRVSQDYGREKSFGLCQLGLPRAGIDKDRFLSDYKYQLDICWKYRKSGTPFYGPYRMIKGEKCYIWASKQVIIPGF